MTHLVGDLRKSVAYLLVDLLVSPLLLFRFPGHVQQGPLDESRRCVGAGQKQVVL